MRNWTEEELAKLESVVENDVLYLVLRDGESRHKVFRLLYPSHDQRVRAEAIRQSYYWLLRKQGDLKTREDVEKEFADDLKSLRAELSELRDENRQLEIEYIESLPQSQLPDVEVDNEAFNKKATKIGSALIEINEKISEVGQRLNAILSNSIDYLSRQRYVAALAAMCWEQEIDGKWRTVWGDWEKFKNERSPLATTLEVEAAIVFLPGSGFFGSLPSRISGGSVISSPSQESEVSSLEQ